MQIESLETIALHARTLTMYWVRKNAEKYVSCMHLKLDRMYFVKHLNFTTGLYLNYIGSSRKCRTENET